MNIVYVSNERALSMCGIHTHTHTHTHTHSSSTALLA